MYLSDTIKTAALTIANCAETNQIGFCKIPEEERPLNMVSCFSNCLSCRAQCVSVHWDGKIKVNPDGVPLPPITLY